MLLPPEVGGPEPAVVAQAAAWYAQGLPAPHRVGLRGDLVVLGLLARSRGGGALPAAEEPVRHQVLAALAAHRLGGPGLEGLKVLLSLAAGAERARHELQDGPLPPMVRPDPELAVHSARDWPSRSRADVVVVGSGAGGALVAWALAQAGAEVLVVEEGRWHRGAELRRQHPLARWRDLYRDGGATAALGVPPVVLPIGRAVGGSTVVNSGTCYRTPPRVQARWWRRDGLGLAAPGVLEGLLDEVEALLQVAPVPLEVMGRNGQLTLAGAAALGWRAGPLRRNAPGCGGCCQCALGCPRNAKFGVHLSVLPEACASGARIVAEARVRRVRHEGGRALGVEWEDPTGRRGRVDAPVVVVAAGATETPALLRRSGLGRHPGVGRHLALHPALGVAGRFPEPVVGWRGVLQSAGVEELHEREGILLEATATPPGMGSLALPGYGAELVAEMAGADHLATLGAMVADLPSGRVLGARRAIPVYRLALRDAVRLRRALVAAGEVLFAAGAEEVLTGLPRTPRVRSPEALRQAAAEVRDAELHLAAFHPTGSVRAGSDPDRHPCDPEGRLRGTKGVVIADASVLPSCPEVNPQLSIMALALGIGRALGSALAVGGAAP